MSDTEQVAEHFVVVPNTVVNNSVGFAIDAGGSTVKLVFLPKSGERATDLGKDVIAGHTRKLMLSTFPASAVDTVVDFIIEHCEVNTTKGNTVRCTGVNVNAFRKQFKERIKVEVEGEAEFDLVIKAFHFLLSLFPVRSLVFPPHPQGMRDAEDYLRPLQEYVSVQEQHSSHGFGTGAKEKDVGTVEIKEHDVVPCLLAQIGSAFFLYKISSDWTAGVVDMCHTGGKSFLGMSRAICGESKSFDELIHLVDDGSTRHVDVHAAEIKPTEDGGLYQDLPDDLMTFAFGKLSANDPGKFI